jgi:uncharacterized SAM-binding protein YcdF (DUF218 family)
VARPIKARTPAQSFVASIKFKIALLIGLLVGIFALFAESLWLPALGHWLAMPTNPGEADVIAVFGGGHERTLLATELYRQNMAPVIWHTGWSGIFTTTKGDIVETNKEFLNTVPENTRVLLSTNSTWEDAQAIASLAQENEVQSVLIVTDWAHSRRALCSLRRAMGNSAVTVYYTQVPIDEGAQTPDDWWQNRNARVHITDELTKLGYYMLLYQVNPWC